KEIVTAADQLHATVMRFIPTLIVPFRMVRTEHLVLLTLPAIASLNPVVLVESNRWNLLRFWLRAEVRVLRFDLLHLLRSRLFYLGSRISLHVLLIGYRSGTCFSRRLLHTLLALLRRLLIPAVRWHSRRTTRNIRSGRGCICRFAARPSPSVLSGTRLIRRSAGRLTRCISFRSVRRFAAALSFSASFRTRLTGCATIIDRAVFFSPTGLLRGPLLTVGGVWSRLCLSRVGFLRGVLAL